MKRILITGMSGTGKSAVIEALQSRGFEAIDTDYDDWREFMNYNGEPDWIWRAERMRKLLETPRQGPLFVSGCVPNQGKFYEFFDCKVLLSAPLEVILERVQRRTSNPYGKTAEERAAIRWNYEHIEPLLRKRADFELNSCKLGPEALTDFLIELAMKP